MQPIISRYRARAEYIGKANAYNLHPGHTYDAEIEVDFEHGYVYILIIRPLPEHALKLRYQNFKDMEHSWRLDSMRYERS